MLDPDTIKTLGAIATTAILTSGGAWEVARRTRTKFTSELHTWQTEQVKQERSWRVEAENERLKDSRQCDDRIDGLRVKYDALRDKYDEMAEKNSDLRVMVHDMRGELLAYKQTAMPGGRRYLDPPKAG